MATSLEGTDGNPTDLLLKEKLNLKDDGNNLDSGGESENEKTHVHRIFHNIGDALPNFDPVKDEINILDWIDKMEECGDLYNWDEVAIKHFALSKLQGVAKKWRDSLPSERRSWEEWKGLLYETFPANIGAVDLRINAENYKRKNNQNVTEYFFEKLTLCNKASMLPEEAIEWIVRGLENNRFRDYLGPLHRYKYPSELLPDIKSADSYIGSVQKSVPVRSFNQNLKENQTGSFRNPVKKEVSCFRCHEKGHYSRQCPKGNVNNQIGGQHREGGFSTSQSAGRLSSGSNNSSSFRKPENAIQVIGNQSNHQKYFKDALINDKPIKSYVDLGSSCVTIRLEDAECNGFTFMESEDLQPLVGYGNGIVKPLGIFSAKITVDGVEAKCKIHVVPNSMQVVPLLIGHPFTEQKHVSVLSDHSGLKINQINFNIESVSKDKAVLRADVNQVIPSNYLGHVTVVGDQKDVDVCINAGFRESGQVIPGCVVTTNECGKTVVPILNISESPLEIKEGCILARGDVCVQGPDIVTLVKDVNNLENDKKLLIEDINTDVKGEDAEQLLNLMNEFTDIIGDDITKLKCTDKIEMEIELNDNKPVYYRPYRLAAAEREQLNVIVGDLKTAGIIEDSKSPFASPVILVRKKTGEYRLCIDYRSLNKITVKDHFPLPRIDDQLDRLYNKKYFSSLDLMSGYYQVPMKKDSVEKTAFITPDGKYNFLRMPFGLTNAPSVFQRLLNVILGNLSYTTAMAYLDDIIIPSMNIKEGLDNLKLILEIIRNANLTLNLKKCTFLKTKIDYLGFTISLNSIGPGEKKINCLKDFPRPTDIKSLRSFIGLASYFRRFVKHFAIVLKPLSDLLLKDAKFVWARDQETAFELIKTLLTTGPALAIYNPKARTELHTDGSSAGLGGVLLQEQSDSKLHAISCYSRKTTKDESKYTSIELEALAIVCCLERFRVYLIGIRFLIKTDCNSLKLLESKRDMNPRIARWFVRLSEFNYTIEHISGSINRVADSLSRYPVEEAKEIELFGLPVLGISITTDWVAAMQRNSEEILSVRNKLEEGDSTTHEKFTMYNSRVYKKSKKEDKWRLYVPVELRLELISEAHRNLAHMGIDKTLLKLKETYYFPKMREAVTTYVNRCINCLYYKTSSGKPPGFLHPLEKGSVPFQTVHTDHLGPIEKTNNENLHVLAIIDGFSKYVFLKATVSTGTVEVIAAFREFISHYGKPARIISDRGTAFTSHDFQAFCDEYDIQHVKIATATPRANGQCERINRTITQSLSILTDLVEEEDWDEKLPEVQWIMNNTIHRATKQTPSEIIFTYKSIGLKENPLTVEIERINLDVGNKKPVINTEQLLKDNSIKLKEQYDKKRRKAPEFTIGDLVMLDIEPAGDKRKLRIRRRGPYEIVKVLDKDRCVIKDIEGEKQSLREYSGIISVDKLKLIPKSRLDFEYY